MEKQHAAVNVELENCRMAKGITYRELADRLGIGSATMSRILNGKQRPQPRTIAKLCRYLECTPGQINLDEVAK